MVKSVSKELGKIPTWGGGGIFNHTIKLIIKISTKELEKKL